MSKENFDIQNSMFLVHYSSLSASYSRDGAHETDPDAGIGFSAVFKSPDKIKTNYFEDIFETDECFSIILFFVYINSICATNQVPVEVAEVRDLVREEAVEMMLYMQC